MGVSPSLLPIPPPILMPRLSRTFFLMAVVLCVSWGPSSRRALFKNEDILWQPEKKCKVDQFNGLCQGRNCNEMWILSKGLPVGYPWHFKTNKDIITKFKWHTFQIIKINRKKFGESGITPSYFPTLMNMTIFGHFSQYTWRQGIKQTTNLPFILKF